MHHNISGLRIPESGHFVVGEEIVVRGDCRMNKDRPSAMMMRGKIAGVDNDEWPYRVEFSDGRYNNWFKGYHLILAREYDIIQKYLTAPDTIVEIFETKELGPTVYAVKVIGEDIWLDAFFFQFEAESFIRNHNLKTK